MFAKPPRAGEAKTRLAPALGAEGAAALAHAFFLDTWTTACRISWGDVVLATTDVKDSGWESLGDHQIWPQGPGSLGDRMERVLTCALVRYPFAIIIGTDLPGLPRQRLDEACAALRTSDAVLGPTVDGGFYLIGLRRCPQGLLARVPWSSPDTFPRALDGLRAARLSTDVMPPWFDIDDPDDLRKLRRLIRRGEIQAPETARVMSGERISNVPGGDA